MARKTSKKESVKKNKSMFIDGWGLILLIIGIALFILRQDILFIGIFIILIGLIRIIYVLIKYG